MNKRLFWAIMIAGHMLAFIWQCFVNTTYTRDSCEYLDAAQNLRTSGTLYAGELSAPVNERLYTKRPPAYPLILAFFDLLSFGQPWLFHVLLLLVQNLLSLLNIRLLMQLFEHFSIRIRWFLLLLLLLLSPAQIIYANMVMSEIWLQSVFMLLLYCCLRYWQQFQPRHIFLIALLLIAGMLLKPVMAPAVFLFPVLAAVQIFRKKQWLLLAPVLLPLLCWFVYCQWNRQRTGYAEFSSISTINLLHYNTYGVLQKTYGSARADNIIDSIISKASLQPSYAGREAAIKSSCTEILQSHIITYSGMHLKGMFLFFADPGRFDMAVFSGVTNSATGMLYAANEKGNRGIIQQLYETPVVILVLMILAGMVNLIKIVGLCVFGTRRKIPLYIRLFTLMLILYPCVLTGPLGAARFAMPVLPLICFACLMGAAYVRKSPD